MILNYPKHLVVLFEFFVVPLRQFTLVYENYASIVQADLENLQPESLEGQMQWMGCADDRVWTTQSNSPLYVSWVSHIM